MEEKLQFVPSLKDAFAIGMKNLVPIVLSVLLWLVTVWIPGSNNIVVFLTIQYYCLSLRHE